MPLLFARVLLLFIIAGLNFFELIEADAQAMLQPISANIPPVVGSTYGNTPNRYTDASNDPNRFRHQDGLGRVCLSVGGYGRPFATNANLYDHVIVATNNCPRSISIEVCYYQTRNCVNLEVPGSQRKEVILGIQPSVKNFKYEFREKSG